MMYLPVWVDDNYCGGCPNGGHAWGTDAFATILDGINAVAESSTVYVPVGTYQEWLFTHMDSITLEDVESL